MMGLSRTTGHAIDGDAHLLQSLQDILTTPIGSRLMRRDYGSLVPFLIDQPANPQLLMRLRAAITHAILKWEPRVRIGRVMLQVDDQGVATLVLEYERTHRGQKAKASIGLRAAT
ncbi:MAG: GPW/gp25 family protein [Pseudomonadota bacterium]|nr:GPW/gp25 family protein [Pseudomonadota bacterium]